MLQAHCIRLSIAMFWLKLTMRKAFSATTVSNTKMGPNVEQIPVPQNLVGTNAAVFFLLNKIEQQRAQSRSVTLSSNSRVKPEVPVEQKVASTQPLILTDEFLFT